MANTKPVVLVTGGAGFIGSHACKALAAANYLAVSYDNLSTGHIEAVKWGPLHRGDVLDTDRLTAVLRESQAQAVMHFAASAYVGESVSDPQKYYRNNVVGMSSLLDAMSATRLKTLVFSSSCATYGEPVHSPIDEDTPQRPINPYGRTKLICEEMVRDTAYAHGLCYAILRYFNAAGADPEGELIEHHKPETHLIPSVLMAALGLRDEIQVFGDTFPTPDGTCIRDYIHVTDLAHGHVLALTHLLRTGDSLTLNLGTGQGSSVRDVIRACEACVDRPIPQRMVAARAGDPPLLVADANRAQTALGFIPTHSDLPMIVKDAWAALQKLPRG
ncbi:MAG: UDP-glucose 4-epimerase GalE [Novosphingobium sp.]|uniref:UDP-glucose 4-epimerase GalE n=1 Tax=Novosphingobium sp. TaxID=1874826 RepID=UPI0032BDECC0